MKRIRKILTKTRHTRNPIFPLLIALSIFSFAAERAVAVPKTCESLAQLALPNTKIIAAQPVTTGEFTPPGKTASIKGLPAFCRVAATLTPSTDSDIKVEVWLPLSGWNGKYSAFIPARATGPKLVTGPRILGLRLAHCRCFQDEFAEAGGRCSLTRSTETE